MGFPYHQNLTGAYLYRISTETKSVIGKMTLLK